MTSPKSTSAARTSFSLLTVGLLMLLPTLSGCGAFGSDSGVEIDTSYVESELEKWATEEADTDATAECPSQISRQPGQSFNCILNEKASGLGIPVAVTVENEAGDITWKVDN